MKVINNMVKRILCLATSLLLFTSCGSIEKSNKAIEEKVDTETITSSVSNIEESSHETEEHNHSDEEVVQLSFDVSKYAKDLVANVMSESIMDFMETALTEGINEIADNKVHYFEIDTSKNLEEFDISLSSDSIEQNYLLSISDITEEDIASSYLVKNVEDDTERKVLASLLYDYLRSGYIAYYIDISNVDFTVIYTREDIVQDITPELLKGMADYNDNNCGVFNYRYMMQERFKQYQDDNGSYYNYVARLLYQYSKEWVKREKEFGTNIESGWYVFSISYLTQSEYSDLSSWFAMEMSQALKSKGIFYGYAAVHIVNYEIRDAYYYDTDVFSDTDFSSIPSYIGHCKK